MIEQYVRHMFLGAGLKRAKLRRSVSLEAILLKDRQTQRGVRMLLDSVL